MGRAFPAQNRRLGHRARQLCFCPRSKGCAAERGGAVARLSRICLWFEDDFDTRGGAAAFVRDHVDGGSAAARALDGGAALRYFPYDWSLNKVAK